MTKHIRVENADTNKEYPIMIHTQELGADGWRTTETKELFIVELREILLHSHKRIIVQELLSGPAGELHNEKARS